MSTNFYDDPLEGAVTKPDPVPVPNLAVIERWATALESEKYGQTTGKLTDGEGNFCCLGVLCELAVEDGVIGPVVEHLEEECDCGDCEAPELTHLYDKSSGVLPRSVANWAGIDASPVFNVPGLGPDDEGPQGNTAAATELNDSWYWGFPLIAKAIRNTYLEGNVPESVTDPGTDSGDVPNLAAS